MPLTVTNNTKKKLDHAKILIQNATYNAVRETTDFFYKQVFKNLSLPSHTPYELKMLDHPFADRHTIIKPHGHTPLWGVHIEYGTMRRELRKSVENIQDKYIYGFIGWLDGYSPEVGYVIHGTYKMIPRPVLRLTATQIGLEKVFRDNIIKQLGEIKNDG